MIALFLSAGFLIIAGAVFGKLAGNTSTPQLIFASVVGVIVAAMALFFV